MSKWLVYEHISPSRKIYVGITKQKPKDRWKNGTGYLRKDNHQPLIANAIKKYGWNNFTHYIIASNLTLEEAAEIETSRILKYKKLNISYNITNGGEGWEGCKHTSETITKLRKAKLGKKQSPSVVKDRINRRISNYDYIILAVKDSTILSFNTAKKAAEFLNIKNRCNISAAVYGKQCLVNGYFFLHWEKNVPIFKNTVINIASDFINFKYKRT